MHPDPPGDRAGRTVRVALVWAEEHALLADSMGVALGVDPMLDVFVVQIPPIANVSRVSAAVPKVIVIEDLSLAGRLRAECPQA